MYYREYCQKKLAEGEKCDLFQQLDFINKMGINEYIFKDDYQETNDIERKCRAAVMLSATELSFFWNKHGLNADWSKKDQSHKHELIKPEDLESISAFMVLDMMARHCPLRYEIASEIVMTMTRGIDKKQNRN